MPRRATGSIQRRGERFYVRLTRPDGTRTTRGSWPTRKDAENAVPALLAEIRDAAVEQLSPGLMQFVESEYRAILRTRLSAKTLRIVVPQLKAFALWWAKDHDPLRMRDVARADVDAYCAHLAESIMTSTVRRHVDTLRQAWVAALRRGYVDEQVWSGVRLRKEHDLVVPWVEPADLAKLVLAVPPRNRDFVQLLAETGLRRGEAYALEWSDVDLPRARVLVRRSKSRKPREVPLLPSTVEMLRGRREARTGALVFGTRPSYDVLRQDVNVAAARTGIPHLRVHDLRHVYASHLVRAGVRVPTVAALLGHSDGGTLVLLRYGRWEPDDAADRALERLAAFRSATPAVATVAAAAAYRA
jgi:integrase